MACNNRAALFAGAALLKLTLLVRFDTRRILRSTRRSALMGRLEPNASCSAVALRGARSELPRWYILLLSRLRLC